MTRIVKNLIVLVTLVALTTFALFLVPWLLIQSINMLWGLSTEFTLASWASATFLITLLSAGKFTGRG